MLIYQPVFDPYHCVFRACAILSRLPETAIEVDRWRILDFYLLFPELLVDFTFPTELKGLRKSLPRSHSRFRKITDPKRVFFRLEPIQVLALTFLASHEIIDVSRLIEERKVYYLPSKLPARLQDLIQAKESDREVLDLLTGSLATIELYGKSGLRGRSDLFQYQYDVPSASSD